MFPKDIPLRVPESTTLDPKDLHFLIYVPWSQGYLDFVPSEYRDFFHEILPLLAARTTDVHKNPKFSSSDLYAIS